MLGKTADAAALERAPTASAEIDSAQYAEGGGPCLEAFATGKVVTIDSIADDDRWPAFAATARQHGILSTLSVPLTVGGEATGAINFYAPAPGGFTAEHQRIASEFASHAAVVLANAQAYWASYEFGQSLQEAMKSRAVIEQAKGVLMSQSHVSEDDAFDLLRRASQRENRKLREIAQQIVEQTRREENA